MRILVLLFLVTVTSTVFAQQDTSVNNLMASMDEKKTNQKAPVKIFFSQKLINANTVEVLHKGISVFAHHFVC